jgi:hypothetical protein
MKADKRDYERETYLCDNITADINAVHVNEKIKFEGPVKEGVGRFLTILEN